MQTDVFAERYAQQGYVAVAGVLPAEVAAVFLSITQKGMGDTRDAQARFTAQVGPLDKPAYDVYSSDYTAALTLLWGMTPFMAQVTGKALLPTYAYFRVYQQGGLCLVHSDRPACEHSMSLALGSSDGCPWPFAIARRALDGEDRLGVRPDFGGEDYASLELAAGDAVVYQGVRHRHGRIVPNPNRWSAHLFMHWVDRDGPYRDHAFDRRRLPAPADFHF